jgi:hypothetical protein
MEIIKNSLKWLYSCRYLNEHDNSKNLLIYTNTIFFIVAFITIKFKKNFNEKKIKHIVAIILIFTMGIISTLYHYTQCHNISESYINKWLNLDVTVALISTSIILPMYYKNIDLKILILILITIILFVIPSSNNLYIICHSFWHLFVGLIFYFLIIND